MNRAQRRKIERDKKEKIFKKAAAEPEQTDFSGVPLATMCLSIQLLVNELYKRGFPVYDFDNKKKFLHGIQIIRGKVYFLAAEEEMEYEKL